MGPKANRAQLPSPSGADAATLTDTLEKLPDAVIVVDAQWRVTLANAEARKRLQNEGVVGSDFWAIMPEANQQARDHHYRHAMREKTNVRFEQEWRRPGAWFVVRIRPLDEGLIIVLTDVTDLKQADEELKVREDRYRLMFDRNPQPMFAYDTQSYKFVMANDAMVERYGYSRDEIKNMTVFDILRPEDAERARKLMATPRPALTSAGIWRHVTKTGVIAVEVSSHAFLMSGRLMRVVVSIDVTERLRAEEALRRSEDLHRTLGDAMPQLMFSMKPDGSFEYVNPRFNETTGLTAEEVAQRGWSSFIHPEDLPAATRCWGEKQVDPQITEMELRFRQVDGSYRWYLTRTAPLADPDGKVIKWVGVAADIDELKNIQEELQKAKESAEAANDAKDRFLAVLSHELRTPLTPVLLIASSLRDDSTLSGELRDSVTMISQQIELEARLIDDLLDLTPAIARGKFLLEFKDLDGHATLKRAIDACLPTIEANAVRFEMHLDAQRHELHADAARLQQLLCNLLNNSAKFTPAGGKITVATRNEDSNLVIEVRDSGVGIEAAVLPRLFNAFEQGERAITRKFGGLGLGLTIGKTIAQMHGGSLEAASAGRNQGATLTLRLPLQTKARPAESPAAKPVESTRRAKVLVVDDHEPTLRMMTRLLSGMGHQVIGAESAEEAIKLAEAQLPDVLLSDIGMPNQSGWADIS